MNILDDVAEKLVIEGRGRGFFLVQYDSKDGKGVQYRWKAEDMETMLGFLIPIVDSICNEYVENEGYLVHESIRATVEKTMLLNDKQPSDEMFEKNIALLREICKNAKWEPEEDNSEESDLYRNKYEELSHALRCCAEMNCVECPRLPKTDEEDHYDTLCQQALLSEASEIFDELSRK